MDGSSGDGSSKRTSADDAVQEWLLRADVARPTAVVDLHSPAARFLRQAEELEGYGCMDG
jgi:hypothetical protein